MEITILKFLNSWTVSSVAVEAVVKFLASGFIYLFLVLLILWTILVFRRKEEFNRRFKIAAGAIFSGLLARLVLVEIIRFFYNRPRPFEIVEGLKQVMEHAAGGSFPSGHASFSFAAASFLAFYYPQTSILFFVLAAGMGLGRVAAGVHYPTDILGGAIIGIFSGFICRWASKKIRLIKTPT